MFEQSHMLLWSYTYFFYFQQKAVENYYRSALRHILRLFYFLLKNEKKKNNNSIHLFVMLSLWEGLVKFSGRPCYWLFQLVQRLTLYQGTTSGHPSNAVHARTDSIWIGNRPTYRRSSIPLLTILTTNTLTNTTYQQPLATPLQLLT